MQMKSLLSIVILVIIIALLAAVPTLAVPEMAATKGEVAAVDPTGGTVTLKLKKGEPVTVIVPTNFDLDLIEVGDWMLVKGAVSPDNSIEAVWLKQIGKGSGKNENQDKLEGKKDNSAFCAEDKQEKPHPLAAKIGEHFDVSEDWVMDYFCDGYSMGAIMLALKTAELEGSDPEELLESRAQGKGWGQIWKDKGLISSEKDGHSPPGLLKRPDHAGPKDKDD
jgi:hypothetical protein